jgi:hypothetical protein
MTAVRIPKETLPHYSNYLALLQIKHKTHGKEVQKKGLSAISSGTLLWESSTRDGGKYFINH